MKKFVFLFSVYFSTANLLAQNPCENLGFEHGDFTNWDAATGCAPGTVNYPQPPNCSIATGCCPISGFKSNGTNAQLYDPLARHTLIDTASGSDPCSGLTMLAPEGRNYSVRLGNNQVLGQAEELSRTMAVSATSNIFSYWYQIVLQDPGHAAGEKPFLEIIVYDENGDTLPGTYFHSSTSPDTSFIYSSPCGGVKYTAWTQVDLDVTAYTGQSVTVKFRTADCAQGDHYGYAYIDFHCPNSVDIAEAEEKPSFSIHPNPSKDGLFTIDGLAIGTQIKVLNMLGEVVFEVGDTREKLKMDLSSLPAGQYFVRLIQEDQIALEKLVITK